MNGVVTIAALGVLGLAGFMLYKQMNPAPRSDITIAFPQVGRGDIVGPAEQKFREATQAGAREVGSSIGGDSFKSLGEIFSTGAGALWEAFG